MDFREQQIQRYARHILLPQVGGTGQKKLLESKVLVIGAGGLGSPVIMYLAAAGVGTIGVVDDDVVDISNLQRQILHAMDGIGVSKVASAAQAVAAINPDVRLREHPYRITADNAMDLVSQYDVVVDGSDNFNTRYLAGDACYLARKPLVSGAILRFDGQISTFKNFPGGDEGGPCYRCVFPEPPPAGQIPSCSEAGVLGALCGTVGSLQATEVLKEILGIGQSLSGRMIFYDALSSEFQSVKIRRDPNCALCGESPVIQNLDCHKGAEGALCRG